MMLPTRHVITLGVAGFLLFGAVVFAATRYSAPAEPGARDADAVAALEEDQGPQLDRAEYDRLMRRLAHLDDVPEEDDGEAQEGEGERADAEPPLWPVRDVAYPLPGALLPFNRIVAYYGNFYSRGMGILGEHSAEVVAERLLAEVRRWEEADPGTPVIPAIDYIAVVAQAAAGRDGMYRARMPDSEIAKALALAERVDGIVILEVQPGFADLLAEVRALDRYLALPQVHLAIDPEFAMARRGRPPGTVVGTVDATDVNAVIEHLAELVREHDLPPKVLVVHRYTRPMVTNAAGIVPLPEVQVVMDMDGWGSPGAKFATYRAYVAAEPVQFTGFKVFYRNDLRPAGSRLLTPAEILGLLPRPSFIQYQ